ncbi:MAG TPA: hypothetical protein VFS33_00100 [Gemmatimonadales bacterium]|nr:hypothetical protein [Gemmatimonadales bacterium]
MVVYALIGLAAGILAGLFGIGRGLIIGAYLGALLGAEFKPVVLTRFFAVLLAIVAVRL